MEEPNINNLEQFNQVSTGAVPQNLNPEAWVSRQSDTLGGLQSFATVAELCEFHPNKMFLYMEANVGADDKYRLITKPDISDFPLSQTDTDPNYFLNFWELKNTEIETQKRFNLFAAEGVSNQLRFFKIAQINNTTANTQVNLKLSIQTNLGHSGLLNLDAVLNSSAQIIGSLSNINYTEFNDGVLEDLYLQQRSVSNNLEIWASIDSGTLAGRLYYTILHDNSNNDQSWQFFEDVTTVTSVSPSLSTISRFKYSANVVDDVRVSNNQLQQRKYSQDGQLGSYVNKSPLITTLSIDKSGNQYLRPVINGQPDLIDLFPIIDSRINSTSNLISTRLRNNVSTNTGQSTSSSVRVNFFINNPSQRSRVAIINFECVVQRDSGGNEEFDLGIRRGLSSGAVSPTLGILESVNRFIINADSLHQRTSTCYISIPSNTTYYFCAYARIVSGDLARWFGSVKYSHVLL